MRRSKNKHTSGPWKLKPTDRVSHEIINDDGVVITEMHDTEYRDAVLISAAPEMLEALELIQANNRLMNALNTAKDRHILDAIQNVIAKARGEL